MAERFEMHRLLGQALLTAKDVKPYFLNTKGVCKLKALTGRNTLTTEAKGCSETYDVSGDCNVIITANSQLRELVNCSGISAGFRVQRSSCSGSMIC